jgi:flagellar basal-body rod modification protein FlgD
MLNSINSKGNQLQAKDERLAEMKKSQNMFFKLLTTQLQCQDIENTVDMNQMTQQIFQMNELQTLIAIDHKLEEINSNVSSNSSANIANTMLGKYGLTETNKVAVSNNDGTIPISYIIDSNDVVEAAIKVSDEAGNVVHEGKIENVNGNQMANIELQFRDELGNLYLPEGIYNVHILAYDRQSKKPLRTQIYAANKIEQVMNNDGSLIMKNNEKIRPEQIIALQDSPKAISINYNPFLASSNNNMSITDLIKLQNNYNT